MFVNHVAAVPVPYGSIVKHTREGNIHEVMAYTHKSLGNSVHKLSRDHYYNSSVRLLDPDGTVLDPHYFDYLTRHNPDLQFYTDDSGYTFELKKYRSTENRSQSPNEIRKTFKRIRSIINTNVTDPRRCKFITLTYAENMTDTDLLRSDLQSFMQRFKRYIKSLRNKKGNNLNLDFEYISIVEPQGRGAWHAHIIFIFNKQIRYIDNDDVYKIWLAGTSKTKRGFTTTRRIDNVDNVGAYLTAYLADIEVPEDDLSFKQSQFVTSETEDITIKECEVPEYDKFGSPQGKKKKKFIKGGRLHLYPKGFHIYRCSQGIKRPEVEYVPYKEVLQEIGCNASLTFSKTIHLSDGDNFSNTLTYLFFNTKRKIADRKDARSSEKEIIRCAKDFSDNRAFSPSQVFQVDTESNQFVQLQQEDLPAGIQNYMRC